MKHTTKNFANWPALVMLNVRQLEILDAALTELAELQPYRDIDKAEIDELFRIINGDLRRLCKLRDALGGGG
ncbi:MAG: hypothetical protein ACJ8F7_23215 [Gemmataceae bacterium]